MYARLESTFWNDEKIFKLMEEKHLDVIGQYARILSYCSANPQLNGTLTQHSLRFVLELTPKQVKLLSQSHLLDVKSEGVFHVHSWENYERTSAEIDELRKRKARNSKDYRQNRKIVTGDAEKPSPVTEDGVVDDRHRSRENSVTGNTDTYTDTLQFSSASTTVNNPVTPSLEEGDVQQGTLVPASEAVEVQSASGYPEEFERFWKVYPRKVDKKAALRAWKAALKKPGVTNELLVAKAAEYAEDTQGEEPKHIKHAERWLHVEAWNNPRENLHPDEHLNQAQRDERHRAQLIADLKAQEAQQSQAQQITSTPQVGSVASKAAVFLGGAF